MNVIISVLYKLDGKGKENECYAEKIGKNIHIRSFVLRKTKNKTS